VRGVLWGRRVFRGARIERHDGSALSIGAEKAGRKENPQVRERVFLENGMPQRPTHKKDCLGINMGWGLEKRLWKTGGRGNDFVVTKGKNGSW